MTGPRPVKLVFSLSLALGAFLTTAPAQAAPPGVADRALGDRLSGVKVLNRGTVRALGAKKVDVGGGRSATIEQLAAGLFADQDALTADLSKGRAALLADPVVTDEVIETADETILVKSTRVVVTDPAKLAAVSPRFAQRRGRADAPALSEITGDAKVEFDAWKAELAGLPADHPLKQAAAKGDAALLAAVSAGEGDLEITTSVIVPKRDLAVVDGVVQLPAMGADRIDFAHTHAQKRPMGPGAEPVFEIEVSPTVEKKGEVTRRARFLTGDTVGDGFEWSRKWKFPSGYLKLSASAYYGVGLRAPVEVTAVMTPRKLDVTGDTKARYRVELTCRTLDAPAQYYRDSGLSDAKVFSGHELVLEAGFHLGVELKAGWGIIKLSKRVGADFDFGQDFRPPFGSDCASAGGRCGVELWIPAEVTHTSVPIGTPKLHINGSARAGFLLTGTGKVTVQYGALDGNSPAESNHRGDTDSKKQHRLTFDGPASTTTLVTALDPLKKAGDRPFGFELADPRYRWGLELIPGVRADLDIKAGKWIDRTFTAGPVWLDSAGIKLGTLELARHRGTRGKFRFKDGTRTWAP